jgi:hypothetical protein
MDDREVFRIGPPNAANRAEFADAVGGAQSRYAVVTSVAIGSVGSVEFIATSNPSKVSVRGDGIVDRKREVPGNTEDVPYANVMQARENVLDDGLGHCSFPPIDAVDQSLGWRGSRWRTVPARHMALRGRVS